MTAARRRQGRAVPRCAALLMSLHSVAARPPPQPTMTVQQVRRAVGYRAACKLSSFFLLHSWLSNRRHAGSRARGQRLGTQALRQAPRRPFPPLARAAAGGRIFHSTPTQGRRLDTMCAPPCGGLAARHPGRACPCMFAACLQQHAASKRCLRLQAAAWWLWAASPAAASCLAAANGMGRLLPSKRHFYACSACLRHCPPARLPLRTGARPLPRRNSLSRRLALPPHDPPAPQRLAAAHRRPGFPCSPLSGHSLGVAALAACTAPACTALQGRVSCLTSLGFCPLPPSAAGWAWTRRGRVHPNCHPPDRRIAL